jgi:Thiamine monophosphate synthase
MPEPVRLPKLYAILDVACFAPPLRTIAAIAEYARELAAGGVTWLQYRNKVGHTREMLSHARELRRVLGNGVTLIMNDRADICIAAGYQGVHVGQDDLSAEGARTVIGPSRIIGVSTHNLEQLPTARCLLPPRSGTPIPWSAWTGFAPRGLQPANPWWQLAASRAPTRAPYWMRGPTRWPSSPIF